ncbi:MAG: PfkB family carbohydrate kinase [Terriglobales bacterium]
MSTSTSPSTTSTASVSAAAPVLAVGSVAFDSIRTPWGSAERVLGGSATYFSLAASHFAPVRVVGVVGEDFGAEHEAIFRQHGVNIEGIEHAIGKSFFWAGEYEADPNIRHTLTTELNVFAEFSPKLPVSYRDSRVLFLGNIDPRLQIRVRDECATAQLVGGDTMNFWISSQPEQVKTFLGRLDLLMINDGEARQLTGEANLHRAGRRILELGPGAAIIKRGEHGASLYTAGGGYFAISAYPLEDVRDPTGAGDSFAGGVMGYLARHRPEGLSPRPDASEQAILRRAVVYGSVMGSFACERFGVERLRTVTGADVRQRYEAFQALAHFERQA